MLATSRTVIYIANMKYLLPLILFLSLEKTFSQTDSIPYTIAQYAAFKNTDLLFVHTDKHIYTNNEFIWFSAWLLRCGIDSLPLHRFVSLTLVPADRRIPSLHQKFLMTNGYSYGSMKLPDSIAPGEYKLVAYTNMMGADSLPVAVFTQEISLRSLRQSEFVAAATLLEDTTGRKDLLITVRNKITGKPVPDAALSLWCGNSKVINAITNKDGIYRQNLSKLSADNANAAIVMTKVKYKGEVEYLQNKWPWPTAERQLEVHGYPEGGYLVSNVPCNIGWESKTDQGEPVAIRAVIFEGQRAIDTIRTDEHGLGKFLLIPREGALYSIRPITWPAGMSLKKDRYALPVVLQKGITLSLPKAIAGDSLPFNVFAAGFSTVHLVVHNFQKVFQQQDLSIKTGGTRVLLLLNELPKGLMAITLLDSNGRPLAERLFFAHYNEKALCTITSDKKVYEKRQPVTVSFQLTNNQQPAAGFASVACAQANRFDNSKHQDIESFYYLHAALQDAPPYHNSQGYMDSDYLEKVLLVRGWRRYTWQELMAGNYQPPSFYTPAIGGKVILGIGRVKKPLMVTMLNGHASVPYVTTDPKGNFLCAYEQLLVDQEKKLWMSSGDKALENEVIMNDPFVAINKKLASHMPFKSVNADRYLQHAMDLALSELNKVKQLAVVTITAKGSDYSLFAAANACGDYVCPYNILNCFNHVFHPGNRLPVKGKMYSLKGGGQIVYQGCMLEETTLGVLQYDGIKIGKEFYKIDLSEATTGNPLYNSTLYWSPTLTFDKDGKAEATFNTSDITGRFRIVVNGITGENMFYATGIIEVK
jgi:hypothetical protein